MTAAKPFSASPQDLFYLLPQIWAGLELPVETARGEAAVVSEEACESSPTPTHPLSRVFLSQWKLLASEWEAGSRSEGREKKKKNLSRRFLDHATSGNLLQLRALHAHAVVLLALISDCQQSWTKRQPHAARHLEWLLKILLRGRACAVQTARWGLALSLRAHRKFFKLLQRCLMTLSRDYTLGSPPPSSL